MRGHLTFGKFKGRRLSEVPRSYLEWVLANLRDLPLALRRKIRKVLDQLDELEGRAAAGGAQQAADAPRAP
jgi:hypothetical protein